MSFGFFGLVVNPGKTYTQTVSRPFRVSMATYGENVIEGGRSCVKVEIGGETYTLCALTAGKLEQQPLNIVFEVGEEITFSTSGENAVHLTGNFLPEGDDYDSSEDDETDSDVCDAELASEEDVSETDLERLRALVGECASSDDDDEEEDSDFQLAESDGDDGEDLSSETLDQEDDEEDSEVEEDGEVGTDEVMDSPGDHKMPAATSVETGAKRKAENRTPQQVEKKLKDNTTAAVPTPVSKTSANKVDSVGTPAPSASVAQAHPKTGATPLKTPEPKPASAKKQTPQSAPAKAAAAKPAATPENQSGKVLLQTEPKKTKAQRKAESRAAAQAAASQSPASADGKRSTGKENTTTEKKLDNGLIIEDIKVGNGPVATSGAKVSVRYVGKLLKGGKVFDKNTNGKPFSFILGRGEVIKGWDFGVQDMRVGGERRLVIPAPMAYGSSGAPPDIPRNATLEFDIKLVEVKKK